MTGRMAGPSGRSTSYQHERHRAACSKRLIALFGCGRRLVEPAHDNQRAICTASPSTRFGICEDTIVPFFEQHPLRIVEA